MMSSSGTITSRDRDQDSDSENEELSSDEREIKVPSLKISLKTPEAESSVCLRRRIIQTELNLSPASRTDRGDLEVGITTII